MKQSSILTTPKKIMNPLVWNKDFSLIDEVRSFILEHLYKCLSPHYKNIELWLEDVKIIGSNTSNQYDESSDLDISVEIDERKFKKSNPSAQDKNFHDIKKDINENFSKYCDSLYLRGSNVPVYYHATSVNSAAVSEGVYDVIRRRWVKNPVVIDSSFNPKEAFKKEHSFSLFLSKVFKEYLKEVVLDMKNESNFKKGLYKARILHKVLKTLRNMRFISSPKFSAFDYSLNWDYRNVIFKFLESLGYTDVKSILISLFPNKEDNIETYWKETHVPTEHVLPFIEKLEKAYTKHEVR